MFLREVAGIPVALRRQYHDRSRITDRQLAGCRDLLTRATARVPHYRDRPDYHRRLRTLADLAELPVIDKSWLRADPASFHAEDVAASDCLVFRTSGSTGARVEIRHDRFSHDYHSAALVRRFAATGRYLPWYRLSHIRPFAPPARRFERFGLFRRHVLLTERGLEAITQELLANRPHVVIGYPVHLRALLRELDADQLATLRSSLRMVMTESELLVPQARADLAQAFGVPVFDEYSAFETLNISYDCAHGRAHLSEDRLVVEVLDDRGRPVPDGVEGRLVITPFMERAMPLLRYDIGDRGRIAPQPCPCGRTFRTLELTVGRTNDYVVLPSGRRLYPDTFLHLAATHPGISECFVRQDARGVVRLFVVPAGGQGPSEVAVRESLTRIAGEPFPLEIEPASSTPLTVGGKGKFVASELVQG